MDVGGHHQPPETALVDIALAHESGAVEAEALQPPVEVESRRDGADEQESRSDGCSRRTRANASSSWGTRLLAFTLPNVREERLALDLRRLEVGNRERGMRDDPDRPVVARRPGRGRGRGGSGRSARWRGRAPRPRGGSPAGRFSHSGGMRFSITACPSSRADDTPVPLERVEVRLPVAACRA